MLATPSTACSHTGVCPGAQVTEHPGHFGVPPTLHEGPEAAGTAWVGAAPAAPDRFRTPELAVLVGAGPLMPDFR